MAKGRAALWGLLVLWTVAGCATTKHPDLQVAPDLEYRIGAEDVIEVSVHQAPDLSRTIPVRPDGRISLPLVGDVEVEGKTAKELAAELDERLADYVQAPRVAVIVHEVNAPRVFVVGEVAHPGAYPLRGRLDVVQALALAGGLGDFASRSRIILIRRGPDGDIRRIFSWDELVRNGASPLLLPGDTIYVP